MSAEPLAKERRTTGGYDELALAEQGDIDAQFNLALSFQDGHGRTQDYQKASHWFQKAAKQGHSAAQYSLALMHVKGLGVARDDKISAQWYRKAAENGHQAAQFNLAVLYDEGTGVKRDAVMAYVWFALAGAKGQKARSVPHNSKSSIAFRLALSGAKGTTITDGHRNRVRLTLNDTQRETAEQMAHDLYKKYVHPFR